MKRPHRKKGRVFAAMSGGVDSSVAAALLQREGFDVVGVHMKCWSEELNASCTASEDERAARRAAFHLGIPFYTWNFVEEYKERVVEYLIEGYRKGLTPNPDVVCNKEIKFGLFFEKAMNLGADFVATGHYARIRQERDGTFRLLQAKDAEKDQSYFLTFMKPEVLPRILFPVGDYTKPQVRELARRLSLPNAERRDSQGICFVGRVPIGEFLREYIPSRRGSILDTAGRKLGEHDGAFYYTIGQRHGIRLAGGPYYVVSKDVESNTLVVSREERDILREAVRVEQVNWFSQLPEPASPVEVKLRYRQEDTKAVLKRDGENACVLSFQAPQRAVTPGQFAVFYREGTLVGGGVIV